MPTDEPWPNTTDEPTPLVSDVDATTSRCRGTDAEEAPLSTVGSAPGGDRLALESFGRYRLIQELGRGGMGTVYLAHDSQLDRRVALKVPNIEATEGEMYERFYREARAAATLDHPNICPVYDIGTIDGAPYLTMAFIEGESLAQKLRRDGPWSPTEAAALVRDLALALEEAHRRGIVHRDLKPANIMLKSGGVPIIMDFGLARRVGLREVALDPGGAGTPDERLTQVGRIVGTPAYMSPEQCQGDVEAIGPGCDVYSLGVILFELLTGRAPFQGATAAVLQKITSEPVPAPSSVRAGLDPRLDAICLRALRKKIDERFGSMREFAKVLDGYLEGLKRRRRRRLAWFAAVMLAVVIPGTILLAGWIWPKASRNRDTARHAVIGPPEVRSARDAYEREVGKHDPVQLAADAPAAWTRVVQAREAAEKSAAAGIYSEAVNHYGEAESLVKEAARQAARPRLQVAACGAGMELGGTIISRIVKPAAAGPEAEELKAYIEGSIPRLRQRLYRLGVTDDPAEVLAEVEQLHKALEDPAWTVETVQTHKSRFLALVEKKAGKTFGASFNVGYELSWIMGGLSAELKSPGAIKGSAFASFIERAREAAYEGGHPQEMIDALARMADWVKNGKIQDARTFVEKFLTRVTEEQEGLPFFRQPPAVRPAGP
jgi:hypothetical protein